MNRIARRELPDLVEDLVRVLPGIEAQAPLSTWSEELIDEARSIMELLSGLEVGIRLVLNQLQYSLDALSESFDKYDSRCVMLQSSIHEISEFLNSPRYR